MSLVLRLELVIFAIICMILILWVVKKEKLLMKYALVWLLSGFLMIIAVIIPNFMEKISGLLGFEKTSNMIFLGAFALLLYITFSLTIIVSKQSSQIRLLTQEVSILKSKK
jgi:hypothetical protein